jgi:tRNA 2-selenouridine synthase
LDEDEAHCLYIDINIRDALQLKNILLVDARSEDEYAIDTIPGAVNIPVLHNEERAAVGLTYHREGEEAAVALGQRLVAPRLAEKLVLAQGVADRGHSLGVFCWRGGRRSAAMAELFSGAGYIVYRIKGGYKAYRRYVLDYLNRRDLNLKCLVLHGLTGVGKTDLLVRLQSAGLPVIDLEGLAQHRGSVYGQIGLPPSPSQKLFESRIVGRLQEATEQGYFLVECESRKVGNLYTPPLVMEYIRGGIKILIYCSMEQRIKRIREVYAGTLDENLAALEKATASLARKLGRARTETLIGWLKNKEYDRVIGSMLKDYYDPLYQYPEGPASGYELCIDTKNMDEAYEHIKQYIHNSVITRGCDRWK